jgi:hypothetical protein
MFLSTASNTRDWSSHRSSKTTVPSDAFREKWAGEMCQVHSVKMGKKKPFDDASYMPGASVVSIGPLKPTTPFPDTSRRASDRTDADHHLLVRACVNVVTSKYSRSASPEQATLVIGQRTPGIVNKFEIELNC